MTNQQIADNFLRWVNNNYERLQLHHRKYCINTNQEWDDDIFANTYLKIYDKIVKDGINDCSEKGFENYFFISFKQNLRREKQYSRNAKRDSNANLPALQEVYKNSQLTEEEKLKSDLLKDYATIYILTKVEENFSPADNRIFKMKLFDKLTYKQLTEKTGEKAVRQRIVNIKNWLKENVTKDEINKAFNEDYGNLIN